VIYKNARMHYQSRFMSTRPSLLALTQKNLGISSLRIIVTASTVRREAAVGQCPLCPQKRTFVSALSVSALCHKRTWLATQTLQRMTIQKTERSLFR
jgi:hypothetical protein